jgi:translation initiation factor IF-3
LKPPFSGPNKFGNRTNQKQAEHRINEFINVPQVRLVGDNVEPGIYDTRKALAMAEELGLDLVEISPNADPPVAKIIDYKKFLYEKKKKLKEIKAKTVKTIVKEVRFTSETNDHDFEFKCKHARKFLEENAKVKAYVQFKGRGILFAERGQLILLRLAERLSDVGTIEQMPKLEGKRMSMLITPKGKKK